MKVNKINGLALGLLLQALGLLLQGSGFASDLTVNRVDNWGMYNSVSGEWEINRSLGNLTEAGTFRIFATLAAVGPPPFNPSTKSGFVQVGAYYLEASREQIVLIKTDCPRFQFTVQPGTPDTAETAIWRVSVKNTANFRPDLWMGPRLNRMRGNNVYNKTGLGQSFSIRRSRSAVFYVRAQNDGGVGERLRMRSVRSNRYFRYRYYSLTGGRKVVTARIGDGTYRTPILNPGKFINFQVKVTPRYRSGTRRKAMAIRLSSTKVPNKYDLGKSTVSIRR